MPRKAAEQQERDRSAQQPADDDEKHAAQASTRGGDEAPPTSERNHASCAAPAAAMRARGATKGWERPETTRLNGGHVPRCWTLIGNDPATQETTRLWKIAAIGSRGEYNRD